MDLWVVAAAAGAGYIAKNLQNLSVDKKESPVGPSYKYSPNIQSGSTNFLQQLREKTCPLRRLARKTAPDDDDADVDFSEVYRSSNRNKEADSEDYNMGLVPSLPPVYITKEESLCFSEDAENRNIRRANRRQMFRLRSTSCLDEKMEEKTCLYASNISTIGPLLVTDATRGINRSGSNSSFSEFEGCKDETRYENGVSLKMTNTMMRSSSLDQFEKLRKSKECSEKSEMSGSGEEVFGGSFRSQGHGTMLLFITGMTVGILYATTAWKAEVDKLNKQLKQMQSLVQDLHEELDMKEMIMVKDLTNDAAENDTPLSIQEPVASPSGVGVNKSGKIDSLNGNDNKYEENLELLSKIEAELQAELEMLENNMNASSLERISSVVEIDPDFEADIVRGEIKSTTVNAASDSENETTEDTTTTNRSQPSNYAVSPFELSLRLHELIESRLETRIDELETALANSIVSRENVSSSCMDDAYEDRQVLCPIRAVNDDDKRREIV